MGNQSILQHAALLDKDVLLWSLSKLAMFILTAACLWFYSVLLPGQIHGGRNVINWIIFHNSLFVCVCFFNVIVIPSWDSVCFLKRKLKMLISIPFID